MLVGNGVSRLGMVRMMVRLLSMMRVVVLRLELGDLHAKPLVGLTAIHHDMLSLVALAIHGEMVESSGLV